MAPPFLITSIRKLKIPKYQSGGGNTRVIVMNCVLGGERYRYTVYMLLKLWETSTFAQKNRYQGIQAVFTISIRKIKPTAIIIGECYKGQNIHRIPVTQFLFMFLEFFV